ncbi:MAG: hypothetical protein V1690_01815 [Candidatus Moraniibacteriota bacterium]
MTFESLEKIEPAPEIKEEIRLIIERTEIIAKTIGENMNELRSLDNDPFFLEQFSFIKDAMRELNHIVKNDKQIQNMIQAHTSLNHEIGNFEVYLRILSKITELRNQYKYNEAEELLGNLKRKTSDFFNFCSDISKNFEAFKYNVTHEDRYEEQKAA